MPDPMHPPQSESLVEGAPLCARRLMFAIERATPALLAVSEAASAERPAPNKWSPREVIGHLIDSASNNHQRFVRARGKRDLIFEGYEQDEWVVWQRYAEAPWSELVLLWQLYNRHLARVMAATPAAEREELRASHNLDRRAYRSVPADRPASLDYFMNDYVDHLEHHLAQVLK
jgi:hypothetical protein